RGGGAAPADQREAVPVEATAVVVAAAAVVSVVPEPLPELLFEPLFEPLVWPSLAGSAPQRPSGRCGGVLASLSVPVRAQRPLLVTLVPTRSLISWRALSRLSGASYRRSTARWKLSTLPIGAMP